MFDQANDFPFGVSVDRFAHKGLGVSRRRLFIWSRMRVIAGLAGAALAILLSAIATKYLHLVNAPEQRIERLGETPLDDRPQPPWERPPQYGPALLAQEGGGEFPDDHYPLSIALDVPAAGSDRLEPVAVDDLSEPAELVAVEIQSQTVLLNLRTMRDPSTCVADLRGLGMPLAVTYDWINDRLRVFELPSASSLRTGGIESLTRRLVLLYQDVRYRQDSLYIPLQEVDWERMAVDELRQCAPSPVVYHVTPLTTLPPMHFLNLTDPTAHPS